MYNCGTDEMPFYPILILKFNWDTLSNLIGHLKKALLPKSVQIVDLWYFCKNEIALILLPAE